MRSGIYQHVIFLLMHYNDKYMHLRFIVQSKIINSDTTIPNPYQNPYFGNRFQIRTQTDYTCSNSDTYALPRYCTKAKEGSHSLHYLHCLLLRFYASNYSYIIILVPGLYKRSHLRAFKQNPYFGNWLQLWTWAVCMCSNYHECISWNIPKNRHIFFFDLVEAANNKNEMGQQRKTDNL